jgi:hypothetical protein
MARKQEPVVTAPLGERKTYVYAPVYLTEGREWIAVSMADLIRDEAERKDREFRTKFTDWAKANVFQRITRFEMVESPV